MSTRPRPNLWRDVQAISKCDVCGEFDLIVQAIDLTKAAGLAEARRQGWRMARGRWTCPDCLTADTEPGGRP